MSKLTFKYADLTADTLAQFGDDLLYAYEDVESYSATSIEEVLEDAYGNGGDELNGPRTILVHRRKTVTDIDKDGIVSGLIDKWEQMWHEDFEYGSPDDVPKMCPKDAAKFGELVDYMVKESVVWQCDHVATIELTAEDVAKIKKEIV